MYKYDQIYSYEKILIEVRDLILPMIVQSIDPDDISTPGLDRNDLAEIIYTQIMALGYNDYDLNAALNDLFPTRNPYIYPGPDGEDAVNMALHLSVVSKEYKHQIRAFNVFHKLTQELRPHDEVILQVRKHLLAAQLGF